jgi:hypothetical protein
MTKRTTKLERLSLASLFTKFEGLNLARMALTGAAKRQLIGVTLYRDFPFG